MSYILEILILFYCLAQAYWHYHLIKQNRPIKHVLWALIYAAIVIVLFFTAGWKMALAAILIREVSFSPFLNFLRHLPFFYTNPSPQGSVLDRIEQGKSLQIVYLVSLAALVILQFFI